MKLKNKKTGEMGIINYFDNQSIVIYPIDENWNAKGDKKYVYHSLTELNEEWEDYEEPKEHWFIDYDGGIILFIRNEETATDRLMESIGNYFETKEEAEKAVEKLKAWKRLKDNGFKFRRWEIIDGTINFMILPKGDYREKVYKDLRICFGGEE